ncbi:MAG TPA: RdgB/HAM1 family non-canonical purine NTP pyrophosphatase [Xanthobacteraceae bacterium]|jgi:XTP/dITP diphosphohydrolase|nr:MAG: non-canonical purine NTP pyrophosphatase, RdgB/HAM1 family [Azorhizobium sp. 12-66-6]OZA95897.1 MAG: non-canonical purine NTP pyrophosphatase, RdgB/HAM1 family [Rhizobiales bacterium 39-66-18]HQS10278.1 RdgB/HAM1 family non-canonical purine NTP pyrophosphatase [Xanthobacteraceae bacterium]HQS48714.1 RdgB/HAM1 family non-canonical purine NTP pyrophosphatase [Xanthobacteraceae bacterium]
MSHRRLEGRLVVATHNKGKLIEMRMLLDPHGVEAVAAGELGLPEPDETGTTFAANARLKAVAAASAAQLPAFADDSGLVIDALGGQPGIHTARWAGPERDFEKAMETIQSLLVARGATDSDSRTARFVSALCLAWPDGHVEEFEGVVEGELVWPTRGAKGFGYDPMFVPEGHTRTFAEMSAEEKHSMPPLGFGLSHRARAFRQLAQACLEA